MYDDHQTIQLYILMPICMTLRFIQGHSCTGSQKVLHSYSRKLSIDFDEILHAVTKKKKKKNNNNNNNKITTRNEQTNP